MKYAQIVIGPAGCGKSTYCSTIQKHGEAANRTIEVVNLDPAAEYFDYSASGDIRDLISVDDVMEDEDLKLGPNGGLVFCMQYMVENQEWLNDLVNCPGEDDYIVFDCPGQIELYTHLTVMKDFVRLLQQWKFQVCIVYVMDSHFVVDIPSYIAGMLTTLSVMMNLDVPHVSILSKIDLLSASSRNKVEQFLDPSERGLSELIDPNPWMEKHTKLMKKIAKIVDDYGFVHFMPLNITDETSITEALTFIDIRCLQFGEDEDVKTIDPPDPVDDE
ncbi:GPN-loop GTPase 3-like isoform X2 [Artemia franciscana]|uniref:GPN-loop GTPase 3 n=2 Tax=Artemia franciscana TaxID=6661 RepID=A0AA88I7A6_ARTSF|nr:hypothetical protein QYM36_006897 [Artemia franciscana]KAK2716567.1 hypothetical protein QYM36_006897 [Artemia franciscana]